MAYIETTTIVETDKNGRLIRKRQTTIVKDKPGGGIKEITKTRYYPEDEYFMRKQYDSVNRSSMGRIEEAYRDYLESDIWD